MAKTCTVWIIVQQDGQHLLEYDLLLRSIIYSKKTSGVRYLIYYYDQETRMASVKSLRRNRDSSLSFATIETPTVVDLYDENTLKIFFKKYRGFPGFSSDRNIVILWSHGSGLGYFNSTEGPEQVTDYLKDIDVKDFDDRDVNIANQIINYYTFIGSNGSIVETSADLFKTDKVRSLLKPNVKKIIDKVDRERFRYLSASQMSQILKEGFEKVDILISNSCYVQMLEVAFYFRNSVDIMVGPQTTIPFLGYDFFDFFTFLENNTEVDNSALSVRLKTSFLDKYCNEPYKTLLEKHSPGTVKNYIKSVSFSILNLRYFNNDFIQLMNNLGKTIDAFFVNHKFNDTDLNNARRDCKDTTGDGDATVVIDLTYFFDRLRFHKKDEALDQLLKSYDPFLNSDSLRVDYLKAAMNPGNPNFLSFFMLHFGGITEDTRAFITEMLRITFSNTEFTQGLDEWSKFMINWNQNNCVDCFP